MKLNLTHLLLPQFLLGLSQGTNNTLTTKSRETLWEFTTLHVWGELSWEPAAVFHRRRRLIVPPTPHTARGTPGAAAASAAFLCPETLPAPGPPGWSPTCLPSPARSPVLTSLSHSWHATGNGRVSMFQGESPKAELIATARQKCGRHLPDGPWLDQ